MIPYSEDELHVTVAEWLVLAKPDCWWTTIEHGKLGFKRAARNKKRGVKGSIPDLWFIRLGLTYVIELKIPGSYPDAGQKQCHRQMIAAGAVVAVCRSLDEVQGTLAAWGMVRAA